MFEIGTLEFLMSELWLRSRKDPGKFKDKEKFEHK